MKSTRKRKKISLATVFISLIMVAIIVTVIISAVIYTVQYQNSLRQTVKISSEQIVSHVSSSLEKDLEEVNKRMSQIRYKLSEVGSVADEVQSVMSNFFDLIIDAEALILYTESGKVEHHVLSEGNGKLTHISPNDNLSFDKVAFDKLSEDEVHISLPHVQNMIKDKYPWVMTFTIPYTNDVEKMYLSLDLSFVPILENIDGIGVGEQGYVYLIDDNNRIVYHPKQTMVNIGLLNEDLEQFTGVIDSIIVSDDKIIVVKPIENSSWRIVGVSIATNLRAEEIQGIVLGIIIISSVGMLICAVAILLFRKLMYKPINMLIHDIKKFELDINSFDHKNDISVKEIDRLSESFAQLAVRIQSLVKQVVQEETELRRTEYKALQSQINPHFLYNTLDSILWMAERKNNEDVVHMVSALAKLFRISISQGHEYVSIRDEVNHAESYLKIQSYRYKDKFTYKFNIDEEVYDLFCNKITIQPILENAIIHGMSSVDILHIDINVYRTDDKLLIDIIDDGVGISEEKLANITVNSQSSNKGIGLCNVNNRIKINFGDGYGVRIESVEDCGTTVLIELPILSREGTIDEEK